MSEIATEQEVDPYKGRYLGRTKTQKEREKSIRDAEREHWVATLSRLGDGRHNRAATKEERLAFRKAAAMIMQNREA